MSSISSFTNCGGVDDGHDDSDDHDNDHDEILDAGNKGKIVDLVMNTMVISTCTDGEDDSEYDGEHDGGHYVEHKGGDDVEHDGEHDDVHDGGSHLHRVDLVLDGYHVTFHFTHISLARLNTGENNG